MFFRRLSRRALTGLVAAVVAGALSLPAEAAPPRYTIVDLVADPADSGIIFRGINDSGQVAGAFVGPSGVYHAALFSGGSRVELGGGGPDWSFAWDVNNSGVAAGSTHVPGGLPQATRWTGAGPAAALPLLSPPGGPQHIGGQANALNDAGWITGFSAYHTGERFITRAVLWRGDTVTELDAPAGFSSEAFDINTDGLIVGKSGFPDGGSRATLWREGVPLDLGTLGGGFSVATSINDAGWIAGYSTTAQSEHHHATLWRDGVMTDISLPGWLSSEASGINSAGDILGTYTLLGVPDIFAFLHSGGVTYDFRSLLEPGDAADYVLLDSFARLNGNGEFAGAVSRNDDYRTVIFRPVPEPSVAGLALLGLAAGSGVFFRRR